MNPDSLSPVDIYTSIGDIRVALQERRADMVLKRKVDDFFKDHAPAFLEEPDGQYAFFCRPVVSPNREFHYFLDMANLFSLKIRLLEYPDRFVSKNREKRYIAKIFAHTSSGRQGGTNRLSKTLINFSMAEGKPFHGVTTLEGSNLIDLHHTSLKQSHPEVQNALFDITEWFKDVRQHYSHYYLAFLALSIRNGVHLENFIEGDADEYQFFKEKVLPSFLEAERLFGVRPLIHPLLPLEHEKSTEWLHYPTENFKILSGDTITATSHEKG